MTGRQKTLLFVDDNVNIVEAYSTILPQYGYQVDAAYTASESFTLLLKKKYDILIFDMRLPDQTGEEIFVELQSNPKFKLNRDVPVAIFTGYPDDETRLRLLDYGVAAYLTKPFDAKALASVLDNLLETDKRRKVSLSLSRQLEELHRFNFLVFNALPSGLIVVDSKLNIVLANKTAHEVLDQKYESMKGAPLTNYLQQNELEFILAQTDSEGNSNREIDIQVTNYALTLGFTISTLTNKEGNDIGRVLIFRDITGIKAMSEESRRVERLASLGTLASGIAHEIKNPLAGIKAMSQLIEDSSQKEPRIANFANRITSQVDRLNDLLNGFFSIARQKKTERSVFQLQSVFREIIPLIEGAAKKKDVVLEVKTPNGVQVFARPDQLQQVLLNLILNALDAVGRYANVRIEVTEPVDHPQRLPVFGEELVPDKWFMQPANSLIIRIIDDGPGIPEDKQERIFDPFYTTKEQGTGLGLFIVHQLVRDEMGGKIKLHSTPGLTIFAITLPTQPIETGSDIPDGPEPLELPGAPGFKPL